MAFTRNNKKLLGILYFKWVWFTLSKFVWVFYYFHTWSGVMVFWGKIHTTVSVLTALIVLYFYWEVGRSFNRTNLSFSKWLKLKFILKKFLDWLNVFTYNTLFLWGSWLLFYTFVFVCYYFMDVFKTKPIVYWSFNRDISFTKHLVMKVVTLNKW